MEKLRLLRHEHLEYLRENMAINIDMYRQHDMSFLPNPKEVSFEINMPVDLSLLKNLRPSNKHEDEVYNCKLVYKCLGNLKPDIARDERLWTYLTHFHAFDYAFNRWPIKENDLNDIKKCVNHVKAHYFCRTNRDIERNNALSRLWWIAYISSKASIGTAEDNITAFLFRADVRANIIERPSTSRNVRLFSFLLKELSDSYKVYKKTGDLGIFERKRFRELMSKLNELGGYIILDALPDKKLSAILK